MTTKKTPAITCMFVDIGGVLLTNSGIAEGLGIHSILHMDYKSTHAKLASFGLPNDEGVSRETR